ncbi:sodium/proton antiporter, CPA1 family [Sphingomonas laterariae]|uniref:Sodium/proton antiporter, CPA1 family n=1 Tax=Edaphosphingomonas laterariae TaxID=861865 RepID=A0A239K432_9SPHN|nr:Na+/H+ antiporter [Sphingomonas laterariae]SNT12383.1 sodium/proton antiporter, CPA1 family [Sphingomonas laterariae]
METITIILLLLLAVILSGIFSRMVPLPLPRPLFQIALGALIGLAADWRVTLDPEIFFLLFLPPLLFLDGWRIPREDLFKDGKTIVELALGLVVVTVVGMGFFIHWMVPAMPLAVAFGLAAVVSPTDPIAVSAIAQRVSIPKRMMHILEGESLLNDASGLVCLRFAIAAALTGAFSIQDAALNFLWVAFAGIAIGSGFTWIVSRAKSWVSRHYGEEGGAQILISLLIPFGAYLIAEHLHCSGILAAVAAGLTMGFVETSGELEASTRIRRNTVWDMIQFTANGVIFVLLGEQLPAILASSAETVRATGHHEPWWLAIYVIAINFGLAGLRFLWVWASLHLTLFRKGDWHSTPNWRIVAAISFAGVRGAITLAGVLTLPLAMNDGSPFPARDLAIFLAMGVIIVSLLAASLGLPLLLKGLEMPAEHDHQAAEDAARVKAAEAAIAEIEKVQHALAEGRSDADIYVSTASRIMDGYRHRIDSRVGSPENNALGRQSEEIERRLRLAALKAERAQIFRMVRKRELDSEPARKLVRELDLLEARYTVVG